MELHRELGKGYSEAVYQQTLEIVFEEKGIPAEREDYQEKSRLVSQLC